ncbi:MAG: toll/interleukin-1 receptor domain-containing protein [Planctomycetes bacterium]|nr:toll/interleukin-1 receptor domain-containing protein [Planctomycetota bacterium]
MARKITVLIGLFVLIFQPAAIALERGTDDLHVRVIDSGVSTSKMFRTDLGDDERKPGEADKEWAHGRISGFYPAGPLLRRIRENGYKGPVLLHTWPGRTVVGWYNRADCTICGNWGIEALNTLIVDIIMTSRNGMSRHILPDYKTKFFISHSSADHKFAEQLSKSLVARGYGVWYDEWQLCVGDSIIEKLQTGIQNSTYLLVVLSPDSVESRWVREELNSVLIDQVGSATSQILPILYRPCEIPLFLRDKLYADFTGDYYDSIETLLRRLPMHDG